jgi:hypothetical protein
MTMTSSLIISTTVFVVIRILSTFARLILLHHLLVSLSDFSKPSNPNLPVTWFIPTSKDEDDDEDDEDDERRREDDDDDDDDDDDSRLFARKIPELTLDEEQFDILDDKVRAWYIGLKRDPIKRARRIVRIVRSSDQRKQAFKKVINTGNHSGWFRSHDNEVIELPDLELLRDVKTRWDSVYCMIERLLVLRPVSVHMYGHTFCSYC